MNYKRIYKEIIQRARKQNRMKGVVYYETHHIIPTFMFKNNKRNKSGYNAGTLDGNHDDERNLILLTAREHFIAHVLLYKIYKGTRYEWSCGSALQLFFNVATSTHKRVIEGNFHTESKKYEKYRLIGIKSISKRRTGMMPVKDAKTGIMIGEAKVDDPKVLSGEWVHHSKGRIFSEEELENHRIQNSGKGNGNYREMTEEHILRIYKCLRESVIEGKYISENKLDMSIKLEFSEFSRISTVWIKNHFGSIENLMNEYNEKYSTSFELNRFRRSEETRKKSSEALKIFRWVTNGIDNLRIKKVDLDSFLDINKNYKIGRCNVKNKKN